MRLIVGLGNPGRKYEATRHNAGFWWLDGLVRGSSGFRAESRFHGEVAKLQLSTGEVWLLKPDTYMNESGRAVHSLASYYKVEPQDILVAHDELDLVPGVARLKLGGGLSGHNGLRDIAARLGTKDFWRLRIGIGHPREKMQGRQEVADYVLHPPGADDRAAIDHALDEAHRVWKMISAHDLQGAMLKLHTSANGPPSP